MPTIARTLDVRQISPRDRHPTIFSTFASLAAGEALLIVNDHDPAPLRHHFEATMPGAFGWEYVARGPAEWRVAITRLDTERSHSPCCGACGGA